MSIVQQRQGNDDFELLFLHISTFLICTKTHTCSNCCILHISRFLICIIYLHNGKCDTSVQIVVFWSFCTFLICTKAHTCPAQARQWWFQIEICILKQLHVLILTFLHLHTGTHLFKLLYFYVLHISTFLICTKAHTCPAQARQWWFQI